MIQGINVEEIKKYNNMLREYKEKASKIKAEMEFNKAEINRMCAELTVELGMQVTEDNLVQVYNERVEKINSTLENGKEILRQIALSSSDENQLVSAPII